MTFNEIQVVHVSQAMNFSVYPRRITAKMSEKGNKLLAAFTLLIEGGFEQSPIELHLFNLFKAIAVNLFGAYS